VSYGYISFQDIKKVSTEKRVAIGKLHSLEVCVCNSEERKARQRGNAGSGKFLISALATLFKGEDSQKWKGRGPLAVWEKKTKRKGGILSRRRFDIEQE